MISFFSVTYRLKTKGSAKRAKELTPNIPSSEAMLPRVGEFVSSRLDSAKPAYRRVLQVLHDHVQDKHRLQWTHNVIIILGEEVDSI